MTKPCPASNWEAETEAPVWCPCLRLCVPTVLGTHILVVCISGSVKLKTVKHIRSRAVGMGVG